MPRPDTPSRLDGVALPPDLRARLGRLISMIWRETPSRDAERVMAQAVGAFRLSARVARGRWVSLPAARLVRSGLRVPLR